MENEWKQLTIGDVCYVTDGAHTKVERVDQGVMYLTSKNIGAGELKLDSFDFIQQSDFERLFADTKKSQRKLKTGDVLMGIIGTFGNCYIYKDTDKFGISSSVAILRANPEVILPEYLYFVISSNSFFQIVEKYKGGSVQGYTNIATIKALPISVPSLETQQKIVKQLIPLNLKNTLNRQINQTLEQMAQTLFKSWFVDFDPVIDNALDAGNDIPDTLQERAEQRRLLRAKADFQPLPAATRALFPSEFEETELGWVPKGWEVETLETCIDVLESGRRPKGGVAAYTTGIPSIGAESIGGVGNFDFEKLKFVPHDFFSKMKAGKVQDYDVLLYKDGGKPGEFKPRIGMYGKGFPFNEFGINEHVFRIRSKKIGQFFLYCQLGSERVFYDLSVRGGKAAIPGVNQEDVKQQLLIFPSEDLLILFNKYVESKFEKILLTSAESRQLTKLRDVLLPKLISGELALDDLPEDVAEAAKAV